MEFLKGDKEFDFIGRIGPAAGLSALLVVGSLVATSVLGINFGIDFAGGYEIHVKFEETVTEAKIKGIVEPMGLGDARVQRFGDASDNEFLILVREHGTMSDQTKKTIEKDVEALAGGLDNVLDFSIAESGERVAVRFGTPVTEQELREVLLKQELEIRNVESSGREDQPEYVVNLVSIADDIAGAIAEGFDLPEEKAAGIVQRVEFVGPQVGEQLRNQGVMAILTALFFILLYVAVRFDLFFSPGAIVALIHDVILTVGVFSVFQLEFNLPIIAAILAIVGYSLNDTIVVYDRIRENALRLRGRELRALVNTSLNQTLSRTLLTSCTTLLVVLALLIMGGGLIRDFSIALCVGILVGTYSSMFVASPVYILLRERYQTSEDGKNGKGSPKLAASDRAAASSDAA